MPLFDIDLADGSTVTLEADREPTKQEAYDYIKQHEADLPPLQGAESKPTTSALQAAGTAALTGVGPTAAFIAAAEAAAPLGLATYGIAPLVAGTAAALGAGWLQKKGIEAVSPETSKFIQRTEAEHPVAAAVGGLATPAPFAKVGGFAAQNIGKQLAFRAGLGAAVTAGQTLATEQTLPTKEQLAAGVGASLIYGEPRKFMKTLPGMAAAQAGVKRMLPRAAQAAGESAAETAAKLQEQERIPNATPTGTEPLETELPRTPPRPTVPANVAEIRQGTGEQTGSGNRIEGGEGEAQAPPGTQGVQGVRVEPTEVTEEPVKAEEKMQEGVSSVLTTEGAGNAIEAKNQLIRALEQSIEKAVSESEKFPILARERSKKRLSEFTIEGARKEVGQITIDIPGDGRFTVLNTKEALSEVLSRAKRIKTDSTITRPAKATPVKGVRFVPEPIAEIPKPTKPGITPDDIGWDSPFKSPPWRPITDEEAANPSALAKIITTDARIEGSKIPITNTRRLLVMQSKDPADSSVHAVSVYGNPPRVAARALDPELAGTGKSHRNLEAILERYKPLYSVLLKEPVKNFHQKFDSLEDFYSRFGEKASEMAGGNVGVEPTEVTEPVAPPEGPTLGEALPTTAELAHVFKAVKSIPGQLSAESLARHLETPEATGKRQILSAIRKITQHQLDLDPSLAPKEAVARTMDILHEHSQSTDNPEAFSKSLVRFLAGKDRQGNEPEFEDIGHTGETEFESRHGTPSGLPPGVETGGPNFAAELMAASRRLGTAVRSRVTLPQGVEGRYRRAKIAQDDSIEVGNILNQQTVAHEMGHDVDSLIFPSVNMSNSQASLAARVGGNAKDLHSELVKVTELMRGKITGSKGHQAYRKRATELFADYFSLYVHDPAMAKAMAPTFTSGFENAIAKSPIRETIEQLHARNVEPVAPDVGPMVTGQPAGMPGVVTRRPKAPPIPRDFPLAVAGQEAVADSIRTWRSKEQQARIEAEKGQELVPDQRERNDAGAFMEGIPNLEIPGDTIDAVKSRMTPQMKELVKTFGLKLEHLRQEINQFLKGITQGEYLRYLDDYLPHFYANSKSAAGRAAISRFIKESPNAKQRKMPTLKEAVDYGLVPITQDPTKLYQYASDINWRVATSRKYLAAIQKMQTQGGPAVLPASKAPPGWIISNNPLIQRTYARQTPNGTMIWKGGAAFPPDLWRSARMILDMPMSTDLGRAYDSINALTRANAFALAAFHDVTLRSASLGAQMRWYNPIRGLFHLFERNPITGELEGLRSVRSLGKEYLKLQDIVSGWAMDGLHFSWTDSNSYQKQAIDFLDSAAARWKDVPYLGKSLRLARDFQQWRQKGLWRNTHDAYKIAAAEDLLAKALQDAPPGTDPSAVRKQIASLLNDTFGGQEWETKFWLAPQTRQTLARFFLAPDWTLSTLRSVPFVSDAASVTRGHAPRLIGREALPTRFEGMGGNIGRARFWGAEIAALGMATIAAQYAIYQAFGRKDKGDHPWIWDNELGQNRRVDATPLMRQLPWHDPNDQNRYYINLGKRPEEILGWFTDADKIAMSKMARPVAEIFRQITGTEGDFKAEWKRDHETFVESLPARAKSVGSILVPFSLSGNQFALSLPFRKGMTKYKAEQAFESAYELAAEPSRIRSMLRGQPQNIDSLLIQISDAAMANGVDPKASETRAKSFVRGKYYDLFFKALQAKDEKGMDKAANALANLGVSSGKIGASVNRKIKEQGGLLAP
ncbi:MAG TPA: hypothetical protein VF077_13015 [Nitrospiraceae bacterium]